MSVTARIGKGRFKVRQPCAVRIEARCDQALEPGDTVAVQFPHAWTALTGPSFTRELQCANPAGRHYVAVSAPGAEVAFALEIRERQLNFPEGATRHGRHLVATVVRGVVPARSAILIAYENTFAPYVAGTEPVWLRVKGEAPVRAPHLRVVGGAHETLRLIVPSAAETGQPFHVLVVSLDAFDNPSNTRFRHKTLARNDGTIVRADLAFTGTIRVPVRLDAPGVHRFRMDDAVSNAVRVGSKGPYWGDLHVHTGLSSDGQGADPFLYAREVSGLDFAAAAEHCESLGPEGYRICRQRMERGHVPGVFVTIPADERNPRALTGHHNLYFRDMDYFLEHQAVPGKGVKADAQEEAGYLAGLDPARAMLVPHHTGINWRAIGTNNGEMTWTAWRDPGLRPVIEIYSHHGQSEAYAPQHILSYEFNRMRNPERRANVSHPGPHYAQDYWKAGLRIGVIGSSDEHSGQAGRRHGGVAAVWAESLTREAIFDAIRGRRCYATTGERILVEFAVDGVEMGGVARRKKGDRFALRLKVWGTQTLLRVEILRHRFGVDAGFIPILTDAPRPEALDAAYEAEDTLEGACMYYARIVQEPLGWPGMAWTSPVWVNEA